MNGNHIRFGAVGLLTIGTVATLFLGGARAGTSYPRQLEKFDGIRAEAAAELSNAETLRASIAAQLVLADNVVNGEKRDYFGAHCDVIDLKVREKADITQREYIAPCKNNDVQAFFTARDFILANQK